MAEILRLWGIDTVGAFIALGPDKVAERLGEGALDCLTGLAPGHASAPIGAAGGAFTEQIEFEKEVETLEPLLFVLRRFLEQLTGRLTIIHLVAGELELELGLSPAKKKRFPFKGRPHQRSRDSFRTLRAHLETVQTNSPVRLLALTIQPVKLQGHQFGLFEVTLRNPTLFRNRRPPGALCGPSAWHAGFGATHQPDSFRIQPPILTRPFTVRIMNYIRRRCCAGFVRPFRPP